MPETLPFKTRCFLFLQGPHGPFFDQLARQLRRSGARTLRVGFNAGDRAFWRDPSRYISFTGSLSEWPEALICASAQSSEMAALADRSFSRSMSVTMCFSSASRPCVKSSSS